MCTLVLLGQHSKPWKDKDICHGPQAQGPPVSAQWLAHLICDVICKRYKAIGFTTLVGLIGLQQEHCLIGYLIA